MGKALAESFVQSNHLFMDHQGFIYLIGSINGLDILRFEGM